MPFKNYHTARLRDPGEFEKDSFRTKQLTDGVLGVMGKLKDGGGAMQLQSLRFSVSKFDAKAARKWLADNKYKAVEFEEASEDGMDDEKAEDGGDQILKCEKCGYEAPKKFWRESDPLICPTCQGKMVPKHFQLLDIVRSRKCCDEYGYGIHTADGLVIKALDELGSGAQRYAKMAMFDRDDAIKRASQVLTYSDEKMQVDSTASVGSFKAMLPDGIKAPPHTLMLIRNVLTTTRKDRDGDTLRSDGAKVDPHGAFLWQHLFTMPIGKHIAVVDRNKHKVSEVNALLDLNELTEDAAKLVEAKALRFSHGFQALDWEEIKNGRPDGSGPAFDVKSFEVMERSLVSVPSNPDAMVELYSRGKLASEPMKRMGKSLMDSRAVVVKGVTFEAEKAGRTISQRNMDALRDVYEDLEEIAGMEDVPRRITALLERCISRLESVLEAGEPKKMEAEEFAEGKSLDKDITLKQFLVTADAGELKRIKEIVETRIKADDDERIARMVRDVC